MLFPLFALVSNRFSSSRYSLRSTSPFSSLFLIASVSATSVWNPLIEWSSCSSSTSSWILEKEEKGQSAQRSRDLACREQGRRRRGREALAGKEIGFLAFRTGSHRHLHSIYHSRKTCSETSNRLCPSDALSGSRSLSRQIVQDRTTSPFPQLHPSCFPPFPLPPTDSSTLRTSRQYPGFKPKLPTLYDAPPFELPARHDVLPRSSSFPHLLLFQIGSDYQLVSFVLSSDRKRSYQRSLRLGW